MDKDWKSHDVVASIGYDLSSNVNNASPIGWHEFTAVFDMCVGIVLVQSNFVKSNKSRTK